MRSSQAYNRLSGSQRPGITKHSGDVVNLSVGDPGFVTPDFINEAAARAMREGFTHYPPTAGDPELRASIAAGLSAKGGGAFSPDDVFVTHGATGAIYAVMTAYLDPGDEVLSLDPCYSLFRDVALSIGAVPVPVRWTPTFRIDMDALERAVTPRTRMLVLDDPSNPTGTVLTRAEKRAVADFVKRRGLVLLSDETYDRLVYDGGEAVSAAFFADLCDNAVIVNSCSKTFAMTGWRVGYIAARNGLLKAPAKIAQLICGGINYPAQKGAAAAFADTSSWIPDSLAEYTRRRDLVVRLVNQAPNLSCINPQGAFYVFVAFDAPVTAKAMVELCARKGVSVRSGTEFGDGGEGHIRISYAGDPSAYERGIARIADAVAEARSAAVPA